MNFKNKAIIFRRAVVEYRTSDNSRWKSALWCSRVVGKYDQGETLALAQTMNVSVDTVEDLAKAYGLFEDLCAVGNGMYRQYVFWARRCPYIYLSHFRALADARAKYKLSNEEIMGYLVDIVQAEGELSSRNVDDHINKKHGNADWEHYATQVRKKLEKLSSFPDLPKAGRETISKTLDWLKENTNVKQPKRS